LSARFCLSLTCSPAADTGPYATMAHSLPHYRTVVAGMPVGVASLLVSRRSP
jgi:hypothetical protein